MSFNCMSGYPVELGLVMNKYLWKLQEILSLSSTSKNLGRLWLAYTELQGDFTCCNSYLLTQITVSSKDVGLL